MGKGLPLFSVGVEIIRRQPGLEGLFQRRPFLVYDGIPGGVAVAALDYEHLAEPAFVGEAEAGGGGDQFSTRPPMGMPRGLVSLLFAMIGGILRTGADE